MSYHDTPSKSVREYDCAELAALIEIRLKEYLDMCNEYTVRRIEWLMRPERVFFFKLVIPEPLTPEQIQDIKDTIYRRDDGYQRMQRLKTFVGTSISKSASTCFMTPEDIVFIERPAPKNYMFYPFFDENFYE